MSSEIYETLAMQANPFPPGACKDHYYQTPTTKRILEELIYGVAARKGFLVLVGEVGLGKTSLLLQLLPRLEHEGVRTSWVFNTILEKTELLAAIARDFGIAIPEAPHLAELLDTLHSFFLQNSKEGRNCAIIIDEAHQLDFQAMEVLRMLSNLEVGGEKLVQIVLVGQPELRQLLNKPELRQLRSRINLYHELSLLGAEDVGNYVNYKLSMAGSDLKLEGRALKLIVAASGGNARRINLLMEKALYALVARGEQRLTASAVMEGLKDVAAWDSDLAARLRGMQLRRFAILLATGLLGGLVLALVLMFWRPWDSPPVAPKEAATPEVFQPEEHHASVANEGREAQALVNEPAGTMEHGESVQAVDSGQADELVTPPAASPVEERERGTEADPALAAAVEEFLAPWGLEKALREELYKAVRDNDPQAFARAVSAAVLPEQMPLGVIRLREKPGKKFGESSYFSWQRYSGSGPAWLAIWRLPITLRQYAMEERSRDVVALQEQLDLHGYYRMGIDGKVGPGTWKAVELFQGDHNLPVTGVPDAETIFWLYHTTKKAKPGRAVGKSEQ